MDQNYFYKEKKYNKRSKKKQLKYIEPTTHVVSFEEHKMTKEQQEISKIYTNTSLKEVKCFDMGEMSFQCPYCKTKHFKCEEYKNQKLQTTKIVVNVEKYYFQKLNILIYLCHCLKMSMNIHPIFSKI